MLSAGSSQRGVDQREACAVLVPSQRTSHLAAGRASPVDVMRMVKGGWLRADRQRKEILSWVLFILAEHTCSMLAGQGLIKKAQRDQFKCIFPVPKFKGQIIKGSCCFCGH